MSSEMFLATRESILFWNRKNTNTTMNSEKAAIGQKKDVQSNLSYFLLFSFSGSYESVFQVSSKINYCIRLKMLQDMKTKNINLSQLSQYFLSSLSGLLAM